MCIQIKDEQTGAFPFNKSATFWAFLSHQIDEHVVRSSKMVYDEVTKGNDELAEWFKARKDRGLAINASDEVVECMTKISDFVMRAYKDRRSRRFLEGADAWVLAHAMAMGKDGVVVSHESLRHQNAIVKIPAVCHAMGIEKISVFTMLNRLGYIR